LKKTPGRKQEEDEGGKGARQGSGTPNGGSRREPRHVPRVSLLHEGPHPTWRKKIDSIKLTVSEIRNGRKKNQCGQQKEGETRSVFQSSPQLRRRAFEKEKKIRECQEKGWLRPRSSLINRPRAPCSLRRSKRLVENGQKSGAEEEGERPRPGERKRDVRRCVRRMKIRERTRTPTSLLTSDWKVLGTQGEGG